MRVVLAALFVFACGGTAAVLIDSQLASPWPWWAKGVPALAMLAASGLSLFLFNRSGLRPQLRRQSHAVFIADLHAQGLLQREAFQAKRAFAVAEFEDEGSHYFIELDDGRVLYLGGQYLYDFEPLEADDGEPEQQRSFPCREFEVLRHRQAGYVVDIVCRGQVLEPELVAPPFGKREMRDLPEDGELIVDRDYETLKRTRLAAA
ncbi:hypothetical protein ARC20_02985 [Stenotrophomonas panacihumi]|uniref:Uncharacterized protein n=1 Tax=Stenotrophomonas panacihumi TaxID=676599 RepID=A0A0R0APZ2_9GAMM|nr:hypothetical protein [Stenotrophomonas panacihumi]KRG47312.1 hypothetical protein ARC20_02985 [Stenotrophomonas panacihumi]PTN55789.1 hypothetical protein C9J98_04225 [Stenotrophomonas panacihumi]